MGKKKAPPPPDYAAAAREQAAASERLAAQQTVENRPDQINPFGRVSWSQDPSGKWTQQTTLNPEMQSALDQQMGLQRQRSALGSSFMDRVRTDFAQPFSFAGMPARQEMSGAQQLNTGLQNYSPEIQRSLNVSDNPALPQFDASYRDRVASDLMQRMNPVYERQRAELETNLSNRGFEIGSDAYSRALEDLNKRQAAERYNALDIAGNEAQRLFNMGMGARQQAFQEDLQGGQFGNQAIGQMAGMDINRLNAMNQALGQQQGLEQNFAGFQNQLRQQAIQEEMAKRNMSLNEMNALLSGQQVSMPAFGSFNPAARGETPELFDAAKAGYDAQVQNINAQNANKANMFGGAVKLASAAMPFMFSDRRLKQNIKRIGTHDIGVGIYSYTMMGVEQHGVIAQEVQKVRPDLVRRHASGYLTVNYGAL